MRKLFVGAVVASVALMPLLAAAQMSTTTLGTSIDDVNATAYDYVAVVLTKYWPFVLGFLVIIGVIGFGKRAVQALFH